MTMIIIFGTLILIGIAFCLLSLLPKWGRNTDWNIVLGALMIICSIILIIIAICIYIPSKKDSVIKYNQLIQEKISIESMLMTDKNVDRFLLNQSVINYNNKVITDKFNSDRFIHKDYYDQDLDWDGLQFIEWK